MGQRAARVSLSDFVLQRIQIKIKKKIGGGGGGVAGGG